MQKMSDRPVKDVSLNCEDGQDKQVNTSNSIGFARRGECNDNSLLHLMEQHNLFVR